MTAADTTVVQPCYTDALPEAWPSLQVLVLYRAYEPHATEALRRAAARRLARQTLRDWAGDGSVAQLLDVHSPGRGAQFVSISHEPTVSLLAWCCAGALGVDLVCSDSLARVDLQELLATAELYLGPDAAESVAAAAHLSAARTRFAILWARMEAQLKCLGMELDEWRPARARILAGVGSVRVKPVDASGQPCAHWVGCIAWRAQSSSFGSVHSTAASGDGGPNQIRGGR